MTLHPLHDSILIEPISETHADAIHLPDGWRNYTSTGRVVAAGPGKRNKKGLFIPTTLKPGDVVCLPEHEGIPAAGKLVIFFEKDILGVISHG